MEANIIVSGVPRIQDDNENLLRINQAFEIFLRKYPNSIIEGPNLEAIGESSQTISFVVTAFDIDVSREMHSYFEKQLVNLGFYPTSNKKDAKAEVDNLFKKITGNNSSVTYLKDSSRIDDKSESVEAKKTAVKYKQLVSEYGVGDVFASKLASGTITLPPENILLDMANEEIYMLKILSVINGYDSYKTKSRLLVKLKDTPESFRKIIIKSLQKRCDNSKALIIDIPRFAYGFLIFGLLVLAFIIYNIFEGKTPGWFMWIFMSLVAIVYISIGAIIIVDELLNIKKAK